MHNNTVKNIRPNQVQENARDRLAQRERLANRATSILNAIISRDEPGGRITHDMMHRAVETALDLEEMIDRCLRERGGQ